MRFSLAPGETGFSQWLDAMKMVAQLPGGMPPEFRTKLWLQLSEKHLQDNKIDWPRTERVIFSEWSNPDDEELGVQIVKDLHRTGCSLFCGAQGEQNQALLQRVLLAYARWNKSVGYCQGFNMLAAIILQVMDRDEKDAVKVMIYLIDGVLPESYFANNLRGLSVDMAVFRDLMKLRLPKLSRHLDALQQDNSTGNSYEPPLTNVFTMQWFLTLFSNCLPQATVLRVWDLVFLHGNEVLLRTALAIWGILQDRVICVDSADEFYSIMGVVTREMLEFGLMDANNLVKTIAMVDPFPTELQELRDKYLYNISPWTQSVQSAAKRGFRLFHSDNEDTDDTEDEATAKALAAAHGIFRRRESTSRDVATAGPTLDIGVLKQQYAKLLQRQRQAHVIISAACSGTMSSPSVSVNHLLAGKSALVGKGRRIGPPEGAVPPPSSHHRPGKKVQVQKGETLQWKDAPGGSGNEDSQGSAQEARTRRRSSAETSRRTNHEREEGAKPRVTERTVEESFKKKEQKQRNSSSSSSSTELCDDEFHRYSDFDSEETSEGSSKLDKTAETAEAAKTTDSFKRQLSESTREVEILTENIAKEETEEINVQSIRLCALQMVDDIEERLQNCERLRNCPKVKHVEEEKCSPSNLSPSAPVIEPMPLHKQVMPLTESPEQRPRNTDCTEKKFETQLESHFLKRYPDEIATVDLKTSPKITPDADRERSPSLALELGVNSEENLKIDFDELVQKEVNLIPSPERKERNEAKTRSETQVDNFIVNPKVSPEIANVREAPEIIQEISKLERTRNEISPKELQPLASTSKAHESVKTCENEDNPEQIEKQRRKEACLDKEGVVLLSEEPKAIGEESKPKELTVLHEEDKFISQKTQLELVKGKVASPSPIEPCGTEIKGQEIRSGLAVEKEDIIPKKELKKDIIVEKVEDTRAIETEKDFQDSVDEISKLKARLNELSNNSKETSRFLQETRESMALTEEKPAQVFKEPENAISTHESEECEKPKENGQENDSSILNERFPPEKEEHKTLTDNSSKRRKVSGSGKVHFALNEPVTVFCEEELTPKRDTAKSQPDGVSSNVYSTGGTTIDEEAENVSKLGNSTKVQEISENGNKSKGIVLADSPLPAKVESPQKEIPQSIHHNAKELSSAREISETHHDYIRILPGDKVTLLTSPQSEESSQYKGKVSDPFEETNSPEIFQGSNEAPLIKNEVSVRSSSTESKAVTPTIDPAPNASRAQETKQSLIRINPSIENGASELLTSHQKPTINRNQEATVSSVLDQENREILNNAEVTMDHEVPIRLPSPQKGSRIKENNESRSVRFDATEEKQGEIRIEDIVPADDISATVLLPSGGVRLHKKQIDRNRRKTDLIVISWKESQGETIDENPPKQKAQTDDAIETIKKYEQAKSIADKLALSRDEWESKMQRIAELDSVTRAKISELKVDKRETMHRLRGRSISPSLSRQSHTASISQKKLKASTLSFDEITLRTEKLLRESACSSPERRLGEVSGDFLSDSRSASVSSRDPSPGFKYFVQSRRDHDRLSREVSPHWSTARSGTREVSPHLSTKQGSSREVSPHYSTERRRSREISPYLSTGRSSSREVSPHLSTGRNSSREVSPHSAKITEKRSRDVSPPYVKTKNSTSKFKQLIEESYGPSEIADDDDWLPLPKRYQAFSSPTSPDGKFRTKVKYSDFVSPKRFRFKTRPKRQTWSVDDEDEYISVTSYESDSKFEVRTSTGRIEKFQHKSPNDGWCVKVDSAKVTSPRYGPRASDEEPPSHFMLEIEDVSTPSTLTGLGRSSGRYYGSTSSDTSFGNLRPLGSPIKYRKEFFTDALAKEDSDCSHHASRSDDNSLRNIPDLLSDRSMEGLNISRPRSREVSPSCWREKEYLLKKQRDETHNTYKEKYTRDVGLSPDEKPRYNYFKSPDTSLAPGTKMHEENLYFRASATSESGKASPVVSPYKSDRAFSTSKLLHSPGNPSYQRLTKDSSPNKCDTLQSPEEPRTFQVSKPFNKKFLLDSPEDSSRRVTTSEVSTRKLHSPEGQLSRRPISRSPNRQGDSNSRSFLQDSPQEAYSSKLPNSQYPRSPYRYEDSSPRKGNPSIETTQMISPTRHGDNYSSPRRAYPLISPEEVPQRLFSTEPPTSRLSPSTTQRLSNREKALSPNPREENYSSSRKKYAPASPDEEVPSQRFSHTPAGRSPIKYGETVLGRKSSIENTDGRHQSSFSPFPPRSPQRPKDIAVKLGLYPSSGQIYSSKNS